MNSSEVVAAVNQAWQEVKDLPWNERVASVRPKTREFENQWKAYLFDEQEYRGLSAEIMNIVFQKAWEDGHSSGYYEVENVFDELCELAAKIRSM